MILPDVNVLVYAHRRDAVDHQAYRAWLESAINADSALQPVRWPQVAAPAIGMTAAQPR